ncbi:beta-1,4-galactosyltransferase 2-like [Branchiostoma lanceolatum]|uniref:beta-1,4-galactosyltransferase 2-like n=1 Tax=Branchiostoma lanceolatum TaxID=7740 RepID=UPI00345599FF
MWKMRSRCRYLVCLQIVGSFCLAAYVLGTAKHTTEEETAKGEATPSDMNRGLGSTEHHIFKAVGGAEPPTQNNKLQTSTTDTVFQQLPDVERGNDPSPVPGMSGNQGRLSANIYKHKGESREKLVGISHQSDFSIHKISNHTVKLSSRKQLGLINARQFAVESEALDVPLGGKWRPPTTDQSVTSEKIAILVPYRDREEHLKTFLSYIHPFLQRQGRQYGIYVIEQHGDEPLFCKGLLFNIAFNAALDDDDYDCFIFHDVDLIPEDDRNLYTCRDSPRHLSVAIDKFNYTLPYEQLFGGVTALKTSHYRQLNGYSNLFCGWGGEDDDMFKRLYRHKLRVSRPDKDVARYKMLRHSQTPLNPARYSLLKTSMKRASEDGLSSLETMGYQITSTSRKRYFSHILVNIADRNVRRVLRRLPRHVKRV